MCKLSIVVPIYNAERYLNRCIDSLLQIGSQDIEILLIDDGSNDGSSEICGSYSGDVRVKIVHKPNEGIAATRNIALDIAKGEYLYFCDADDYVESKVFDNIDLDSSDLHVFGYVKETIKQNTSSQNIFQLSENILDRKSIKECLHMDTKIIYPLWNKIFRKSIVDANKIRFESVNCWEDAVFVLDYLRHVESVQFHSKLLYHYQVLSGVESLSKQKFIANRKNQYLLLYQRRCLLCDELELSDSEKKKADGRNSLIYSITGDILRNTTFAALKKGYADYQKYYDELFSLQEVKNVFHEHQKLKSFEAKLCVIIVKLVYLTGNRRLFVAFEIGVNIIKRVLRKEKS